MVPLEVYTGQVAGRQQRLILKREESSKKTALKNHSQEGMTFREDGPEEEDFGMDQGGVREERGERISSRNKVNGSGDIDASGRRSMTRLGLGLRLECTY
jgi:hypothetical protein